MTYDKKVTDFILACQAARISGLRTQKLLARQGINMNINTVFQHRKKASDSDFANALVERQLDDIEKSYKGKDDSEARIKYRENIIRLIFPTTTKSIISAEISEGPCAAPLPLDKMSKKEKQAALDYLELQAKYSSGGNSETVP